MKRLTGSFGAASGTAEYLAKKKDAWAKDELEGFTR
jgi:hypothetical protein